jgi:hypothetical protein
VVFMGASLCFCLRPRLGASRKCNTRRHPSPFRLVNN